MIRQIQREGVLEAPYPQIIRILATHQFPVQGRNWIIDHSLVQISAPGQSPPWRGCHTPAISDLSAISAGASVHNAVVYWTHCHRYAMLPRRAGYQ